jgi:ATP-dependent exoDNAse (exonuclease V) beta subunit
MTAQQERAITSEAGRICVLAGPGSGKTTVLVDRVVERVLGRKLSLERLLAITFTDNAAAQMKERLAREIEKRPLEASFRETLLRQLESAYISTVHSFCARLLRENAVAAGIDPRFRVLDEVQAGFLKQEVLAGLLQEWDRRDATGFFEFIRHFKTKDYEKLALDVYDKVRQLGCHPTDEALLLCDAEPFARVVEEVRAEAQATLATARGQASDAALAVIAALRGIETAAPDAAWRAAELAADAVYRKRDIAKLRAAVTTRLLPTVVDLAAAGHRRSIAQLLARLHAAYGARKRGISALDFDDLEQAAADLLVSWPGVLERARAHFDEILVDEYQDTSVVQSRIIDLLAEGRRVFVVGDVAQSIYGFRNAAPEAFLEAWRRAQAGGDPILLREDFRSRPEILHAVNCHFAPAFTGAGLQFEPLVAGSEFRPKSAPSVELLLVGQADAGIGDLRRAEAAHLARTIRQLAGEDEQPAGGSPASRATMDSRLDRTKAKEQPRKLGYADVAMLFRSSTDMWIYQRALDDAGIPYFAETGRGFYETPEVRDVVGFLRALDNSRDEQAMAAVLRSPMFGLSDDALYLLTRHARRNPGGVLDDVLEEAAGVPGMPGEDAGRVARFCSLLAALRERRAWLSLRELVREIVHATGYEATLLLEPGGRRKVANLRKLADLAGTVESGGFEPTLKEFIQAIDRFHLMEVRQGEAQIDSPAENAVRLLTMHRAKGLEFPLVVLPDLTRGSGGERDYLDFLPEYGLGVQYNCAAPGEQPDIRKTLALESIRKRLTVREGAEDARVLFVAMTRAEEHLLLSGCMEQKRGAFAAGNALGGLCASFGIDIAALQADGAWKNQEAGAGESRFDLAICATDTPPPERSFYQGPKSVLYRPAIEAGSPLGIGVHPAVEAEAAQMVAEATRQPPPADSSEFLATVTDVLKFHRCPRRYYLGYYLGYPEGQKKPFPVRAGEPEEPEEDGAPGEDEDFERWELGRAVHDVLARGREALSEVPEPMRPDVQRLAEGFWSAAADDWARRVAGSSEARRELPLIASLKAIASLEDRFLRGALDVLTFQNGRPDLLLDYKANDIGAAEVDRETAHYRIQMVLYALLVQAAFGRLPAEAVLYFLVPGIARSIDLTPAALEEARGLLCSFFQAQKRLSFPQVAADHCYRCPYQGNLCRV